MMLPEILYLPGMVRSGHFAIMFGDDQYVNLKEGYLNIYIKFEGSEKKCTECGGNRELIVCLSLDGDLDYFDECCDVPSVGTMIMGGIHVKM